MVAFCPKTLGQMVLHRRGGNAQGLDKVVNGRRQTFPEN
jgi:hypothetical protein